MATLRFIDGLVIDHDDCERSIMARSHWRPGPSGAVCACTPEPPARDNWDWAYQAVVA